MLRIHLTFYFGLWNWCLWCCWMVIWYHDTVVLTLVCFDLIGTGAASHGEVLGDRAEGGVYRSKHIWRFGSPRRMVVLRSLCHGWFIGFRSTILLLRLDIVAFCIGPTLLVVIRSCHGFSTWEDDHDPSCGRTIDSSCFSWATLLVWTNEGLCESADISTRTTKVKCTDLRVAFFG